MEEKEDLYDSVNGLSSATKIEERMLNSQIKEEVHLHPESKKVVIIHSWWVMDGEDDVMPEFDVVRVYPSLLHYKNEERKSHD